MSEYIGCTIKELPPYQHVEAAQTAVRLNPANRPLPHPSLPPVPPARLALLTSKYWSAKGVKLTVQFLDNPDSATRVKIIAHMNSWNQSANVSFTETRDMGQVRIARENTGYWSYLGTDILHVPAGQATMNLQGFTARGTPDSEFYRVVRHETGHTLAFVHEHLRKEIVARLDVAKTLAYFERTQGWDEQTVRSQVLTPLEDSLLTSLPSDVLSIMCYGISGECTLDGQPIEGGNDIDVEDFLLAGKLYPRAVTPPPPPPPPPVSGQPAVMVIFDDQGKETARFRLTRV